MFNLFLVFLAYYLICLVGSKVQTCLISFSFLFITIIIVKIRNKIIEKKYFDELNLDFDYIREIPKYLDVNDILFLNNKSFSSKKNINLIVMQLALKGIIEIKKEGNSIIFNRTDKIFSVSYAEKYICDYITSDDKSKFNYLEYNKMVKKDILNKKLAYDENDLSFFKFYFFFSSITFLIFASIYIYYINFTLDFDLDESIIIGFILLTFPNIIFLKLDTFTKTLNLKLTKKGWAYKYIVKSYKNFLKDFSRINELKNNDYALWQEHLLYAQALNINLDYYNIPNINMNIFDENQINRNI